MSRAAISDRSHSWFLEKVATAKDRVLLLDYDGTVAPFHADRLRAVPYPAVPHLLRRIMTGCHTRVIMMSGRAAHEIPPLLGIRPSPEIWGTHGLQRLYSDGQLEQFDPGMELRLRCASKGNAVNSLLSQVDAEAAVAYIGNDTTDEEAFRALNGRGLSVLVRRTPRFTAAQLWLRPPDDLLEFLQDWIRASQGDV